MQLEAVENKSDKNNDRTGSKQYVRRRDLQSTQNLDQIYNFEGKRSIDRTSEPENIHLPELLAAHDSHSNNTVIDIPSPKPKGKTS